MPDDPSIEAPPAALVRHLAANEKSYAWVFRVVCVLGWLFLTSHFLSRDEYGKDQTERAKADKDLAVTLEKLNGTLSRYEAQGKIVYDHETRIRALQRDDRGRGRPNP